MESYDYKSRKGVRKISWEEYIQLCRQLAEKIALLDIDIIIGIARAGLYPAAQLAGMLQKEIIPIRLSRRVNDVVRYKKPRWITDIPDSVKEQSVLIVDEIADSGQTLQMVAEKAKKQKASSVTTVTLVTHSWAKPKPELFAVESDELILFPWDDQVLSEGKWILNPEIADALKWQERS